MDVFGGAPRFLAYPRPVIVQSGTDAALKCQISGDPRPTVIWERNNDRIHPEGRYRLFEDGNVYNLIISGVSSEDSGQYICKAKNSIGETYAAATLKVEGEAQEEEVREENRPRFLIKPLSTRVGRGEDAVFSCKLWGKPLPEVVWEKDGKRLNEIFESTHFSVGYQDGGWFQLKIFKTRAPDGGVYTCKAKNEFGEGLAGAVLLVDAGPGHEEEVTRNGYANGHWKAHHGKARGNRQVATRQWDEPLPNSAKVKMFTVTEGKHAKFRCYVTGKPKPEIIWRKDGRVILSGRRYLLYEDREGYFTLKVLYCKQQDNGVYVCAASNTAGQTLSAVHLTVKEPLVRFKQPLTDLEVFERELAVLECEVPEDSIPITWYLEDRRLHPGAKYGMEEWGTKRRLTIRDTGADDDGIYLCEMADGGRSIAEVAVKGTVVRKLPRKVDVLEGENAAFCVEVEEEEMEIHWYKDAVELRETHQTIIKSFGKTHILVFVNASPQDSGKVTFIVGRSKTTSQLRVKAVRHSPPSCPVGVQINTERANAALFSWLPPNDSRRNPPSGYVLERQEVGSQEWLQCLTTDSATAVEILGDSVPCEADYRFRICSVNKYGRSSHVEFPRSAHLVPVAKIQTPLQDALVPEGQDASFTIELSASVIGTWFLNGIQLQEDERFTIRRSRSHHSLRIKGVRDMDNGAEITFIAYGVRDSAALYIQAPLVKFTPLSEMDRNKFVEVGNPIVLYCEVSDPAAPVHWYRNGVELHKVEGLNIQSEGNMRRIVIQSAELSHSGVYSCDAIDDVIRFNVEVEAPPVRLAALPEVAKSKTIESASPITLHSEISEPAQVSWYKDALQLRPQSGIGVQSEDTTRTLAVPPADTIHSGACSSKIKGDELEFKSVEIKVDSASVDAVSIAQPVKFSATPEVERNKSIDAGCPIVLHCEVSDPTAQVSWVKDGVKLHPQSGVEIQSKATIRRLVVRSAQLCHSGVYRCETSDDVVQFTVDIKAPPVKFCSIPEEEKRKSVEAGHLIVLNCQLSDPSAEVTWYKDGSELFLKPGIDIRAAGIRRTLVVEFAQLSDSGTYCCSTADDTLQFNVKVKAPPVRFVNLPEDEKNPSFEAGSPILLCCEISDSNSEVTWYKDEKQLLPSPGVDIQSKGRTRTLTIQSAELSHAGVYSCKTACETIYFNVEIKEPVHTRPFSHEISDDIFHTNADKKAASVDETAEPEAKKIKYTEESPPPALHGEVIIPIAEDETKLLPQTEQYIQSEGTMKRQNYQSMPSLHSTELKKKKSRTGRYVEWDSTMEKVIGQSAQPPQFTPSRDVKCDSGQSLQSEDIMEVVTDPPAKPLDNLTLSIKESTKTGKYVQSKDIMEEAPQCMKVNDSSAESSYLTNWKKNSSETGQHVQTENSMKRVKHHTIQPSLTHVTKNSRETGQNIQSMDIVDRVTDQSAEPSLTNVRMCSSESGQYLQSEDITEQADHQSVQPSYLASSQKNSTETGQCFKHENITERVDDQSEEPSHLAGSRKNATKTVRYIHHEDKSERADDQSEEPSQLATSRKNATKTVQYIQHEDIGVQAGGQSAEPFHLASSGKNGTETVQNIQDEHISEQANDQSAESFHLAHSKKNEIGQNILLDDITQQADDQSEEPFHLAHSRKNKIGQNILLDDITQQADDQSGMASHLARRRKNGTEAGQCILLDDITQQADDQSEELSHSARLRKNGSEPGRCILLENITLQADDLSEEPSHSAHSRRNGSNTARYSQHEDIRKRANERSAEPSHLAHSGKKDTETGRYSQHADIDEGANHQSAKPSHLAQSRKNRTESGRCIQQEGLTERAHDQSPVSSHFALSRKNGTETGQYTQLEDITEKVNNQSPAPSHLTHYGKNSSEIEQYIQSKDIMKKRVTDQSTQLHHMTHSRAIKSEPGQKLRSEDTVERQTAQSAQPPDLTQSKMKKRRSVADEDSTAFKVDVEAPPEDEKGYVVDTDWPTVEHCKISDTTAQIMWSKDGQKILPQPGIDIQSEDTTRELNVQSAKLSHTELYSSETMEDARQIHEDVKALPVRLSTLPEVEKESRTPVEADRPIVQHCVISEPTVQRPTQVSYHQDRLQLLPKASTDSQSEGISRTIDVRSTERSPSGVYTPEKKDDGVQFNLGSEAPSAHFKELSEVERNRAIEAGGSIVLQCEITDPAVQVSWAKDGVQLHPQSGVHIQSEGHARKLVIQSAERSHSGVYSCGFGNEVMTFKVEVQDTRTLRAPLAHFKQLSEVERNWSIEEGRSIALQCEITDPAVQVNWAKDGVQLHPQSGVHIQSEDHVRKLVIQSAERSHSGVYTCGFSDEVMTFKVEVQAPSAHFKELSEVKRNRSIEAGGSIVLQCEITDPAVQVSWAKDGVQLHPQSGVHLQSEGHVRKLVIQSAEHLHSGVYSCSFGDEVMTFKVDVQAPSARFKELSEVERNRSIEAGGSIVLQCEITDPAVQANWAKDGVPLHPQSGVHIQSEGHVRMLAIQSAERSHSGVYTCGFDNEVMTFKVEVQAPLAHFKELSEVERNRSIEAGGSIVLQCEITDPAIQVSWAKDGVQLHPQSGVHIQSEGHVRKLVIQSAERSHSGVYSCGFSDEVMTFKVEVQAPSAHFKELSEVERNRSIEVGGSIVLQCEITNPAVQVSWAKDGMQLLPQSGMHIQSEGHVRKLVVQSAELSHSGVYSCGFGNEVMIFKVDVQAPSAHFKELSEVDRNWSIEAGGSIVLQCEISDPAVQVSWAKDGVQLHPQPGVLIQSEGHVRKLVVQSAERSHSGVYSCNFADEVMTFNVEVQDLPVKFSEIPEAAKSMSVETGNPVVLQCEISESNAQVNWYKDGLQLRPQFGVEIQSKGRTRALTIESAELSHSGTYSCQTADDTITFKVDVKAPPVKFSAIQEIQKNKSVESGRPIVLHCEISDSTAPVSWYRNGLQLLPQSGVVVQSEGTKRTLILQSSEFSSSGVYSCKTADDIIEFYVAVKAPPVTFVEMTQENLHKSVVELDPLVLNCQVSRSDASVLWYKDGVEMQPSYNITIQAEGTMRRLILRSTQLADAGTYTCRAGDNAQIFKVNIREPPVMIIYPKEDVHLDRLVSEEVVLSCELSRSNGTVHWFKDGQKLQESQSIKLKSEGPYRRLKILNCGIDDSGEYVCDTADDSIFFQLSITEPPVKILSPSQSQMELCQQTLERMVLSCEISRSNATVRWYRDGLEVEESENLILEVDGVYRRMIIPETSVRDSAEYVCDTGDDSVTFFVNIAEPPVRFVRPRKMPSAVAIHVGNPLVLECEVSRPSAEASWKKDGEELEESRNVTIIEDGILRQLTIHVAKLEHSGQYMCDARDDVMDFQVKVTEPPVKILKKSELKTEQVYMESDDIVLECELSQENGVVQWSKNSRSVEEDEHFCIEEEGAFRSLVILNATLLDAGEYTCHTAHDSFTFHIKVKERPVSIIGNSESPETHSLLTGDDLILACEVSRSNAPVQWYCNGRLLNPDVRTHIDSCGTVRKLVLKELCPSDSGEYVCDAVDDKMVTLVKVQEPPVKFLNKERANLVTGFENESVTLSAMTSRDTAKVKWLKDWTQISGERFHVKQEGNRHYLTIDPLHRSDSGGYTCDTTGDEMHFSLLVKEMRVKFAQGLEDKVAHKDSMVTLRCQLCRARGDVLWLKDGAEITPSQRLAIRADGPERSLTIHRLTPEDAGVYTCESKDDRTSAELRVDMPRIVEFIAELHSTTVMEGEDATFKCVVSPEDVQLYWLMDGERINPSEKFRISRNGLCHVLNIHRCQVSDSSKITAEAEGVVSRAKLQVQEAQVLFTKKMKSVQAEEFGEATLEVEVSPESGEVHWMRQNVVIQPGPKFTLKQQGNKRSLTIHNLSLSDLGLYRCETLHDYTQGKLSVEPRKITLQRGLKPIETFERETASFEVELSHANVEGVWQKDGIRLKPSNRWRVSTKDHVHSLTLSNLTTEDTGTISFSAESLKTSARLIVREPPVTFLKKLEDQSFPEGSAVSLECELSRQNVEVKWLKNGIELKPSKTQRIYSMGRKRFFQIMKCEIRDSGLYTCDAGDVSTFCSVEVYEQEVEIVQGLEDLDIQEDQNAVFMCEVSLLDIPGEWYRDGEKIKPTSTVKIRQEGAKHFLLMCNVRVEDAGEIKFVAKQVESTATLEVEEMPVCIVKPLRDKTALEGHRVILECTVSNPRCSIRWYQGNKVILPSERFEICSEGCHRKLVIQQVALEDEGTYSVQAGEHTTSARLTVEAQLIVMVRDLEDVTVTAPDAVRFECEVSVPVSKPPNWSLNGKTLHASAEVRLESRNTVHRLTLTNTCADMSGTVRFSCGKAKSSATLTVMDD